MKMKIQTETGFSDVRPSSPPKESAFVIQDFFAEKSDLQVWEAWLNGSEHAFASLYKRHIDALYRFGVQLCPDREVVKDCIQDLFVYLGENERKLPVQSVKAYLFKSLYRLLVKQQRKLKKQEGVGKYVEADNFLLPDEGDEGEQAFMREKIAKVVGQLPRKQQEAFQLFYREGFTYDEIAEIMNVQQRHSVRKLVYKAVAFIRSNVTACLLYFVL